MTEPYNMMEPAGWAQGQLDQLHRDTRENIRKARWMQWNAAGCGMLAYGALLALGHLQAPGAKTGLMNTAGGLLAWSPLVVAILGMAMVAKTQYRVAVQRQRLARIHRYFSPEYNWARGRDAGSFSFNRGLETVIFLEMLLVLGALLVSLHFSGEAGRLLLKLLLLFGWGVFIYLRLWVKNRNEVSMAGLDDAANYK